MKNRKNPQKNRVEEFSYNDEIVYTYVDQQPGEEYYQEDAEKPLDPQSLAMRRKKQQNTILITMLCLIAALLIGVIVIKQTIFRLNNVYVVGVGEEYKAEVINNCGLVRGQDIFSVDAESVRRRLESNNQVAFQNLTIDLPNSVYIYVEKREKAVVLQWAGTLYELDGDCRVLNMHNTTVIPDDVPLVTGLEVNSIQVGKPLSLSNSRQLTYLKELIFELEIQDFKSQVTVISLSSPEDAYLELANGISVRLGNGDNLRAKVGAVKGCMGLSGQMDGELVLNVTIPEKPTVSVGVYRPTSVD